MQWDADYTLIDAVFLYSCSIRDVDIFQHHFYRMVRTGHESSMGFETSGCLNLYETKSLYSFEASAIMMVAVPFVPILIGSLTGKKGEMLY
jgi:hypothetical protein